MHRKNIQYIDIDDRIQRRIDMNKDAQFREDQSIRRKKKHLDPKFDANIAKNTWLGKCAKNNVTEAYIYVMKFEKVSKIGISLDYVDRIRKNRKLHDNFINFEAFIGNVNDISNFEEMIKIKYSKYSISNESNEVFDVSLYNELTNILYKQFTFVKDLYSYNECVNVHNLRCGFSINGFHY